MTDSGAKEWVTIRIPKSTRDDASAKPQTYETIMEAGMAALEGNAEDYAPKYPEGVTPPNTECKFGDGEDMASALAAIENSVETVEERTGKIERVLEGLQG